MCDYPRCWHPGLKARTQVRSLVFTWFILLKIEQFI